MASLYGIPLGLCCHGLKLTAGWPPGAYITRCTAWCAILLGLPMFAVERRERKVRENRAARGLPVPKVYCFTNRHQYHVDDFVVLGGILGLLVTSFGGRRPRVVGWQRHLGGVCIGSAVGYTMYTLTRPPEDNIKKVKEICELSDRLERLREERGDVAKYMETRFGKNSSRQAQPRETGPEEESNSREQCKSNPMML